MPKMEITKEKPRPSAKKQFERKAVISLRIDIEKLGIGKAKAILSGGISMIGKEPLLDTITVVRAQDPEKLWSLLKGGVGEAVAAFEKASGLDRPPTHPLPPNVMNHRRMPPAAEHTELFLANFPAKKAKKPIAGRSAGRVHAQARKKKKEQS